MDGKHVIIRCPPKSGSDYFNYKKNFSIILFAVVDSNYNFLYIDVGTSGRANDASVFSKSALNEALQQNLLNIPAEGVFLADDAFPLRTNILNLTLEQLHQIRPNWFSTTDFQEVEELWKIVLGYQ
jgi:hypothetical protein